MQKAKINRMIGNFLRSILSSWLIHSLDRFYKSDSSQRHSRGLVLIQRTVQTPFGVITDQWSTWPFEDSRARFKFAYRFAHSVLILNSSRTCLIAHARFGEFVYWLAFWPRLENTSRCRRPPMIYRSVVQFVESVQNKYRLEEPDNRSVAGEEEQEVDDRSECSADRST